MEGIIHNSELHVLVFQHHSENRCLDCSLYDLCTEENEYESMRYDLCEKLERTLTADLTALGLNYNSTVSKMKEDAASGVDTEKDGLTKLLVEARDSMNEVPEL